MSSNLEELVKSLKCLNALLRDTLCVLIKKKVDLIPQLDESESRHQEVSLSAAWCQTKWSEHTYSIAPSFDELSSSISFEAIDNPEVVYVFTIDPCHSQRKISTAVPKPRRSDKSPMVPVQWSLFLDMTAPLAVRALSLGKIGRRCSAGRFDDAETPDPL